MLPWLHHNYGDEYECDPISFLTRKKCYHDLCLSREEFPPFHGLSTLTESLWRGPVIIHRSAQISHATVWRNNRPKPRIKPCCLGLAHTGFTATAACHILAGVSHSWPVTSSLIIQVGSSPPGGPRNVWSSSMSHGLTFPSSVYRTELISKSETHHVECPFATRRSRRRAGIAAFDTTWIIHCEIDDEIFISTFHIDKAILHLCNDAFVQELGGEEAEALPRNNLLDLCASIDPKDAFPV